MASRISASSKAYSPRLTSRFCRSDSLASRSSTILTTPASSTTRPSPLGSSSFATSTVAPTPAARCLPRPPPLGRPAAPRLLHDPAEPARVFELRHQHGRADPRRAVPRQQLAEGPVRDQGPVPVHAEPDPALPTHGGHARPPPP